MFFLLSQTTPYWLGIFLAVIVGYLSGSVPYGLVLGRLAGLGDIRSAGSGNIGATNVLRLGGKKLGIIALLLDMLKGFVPVIVAANFFHMDYAVMIGLSAFLGHLFPVWLRFKGGKGVATALGVVLGLSLITGIILCLIWVATAAITRYSSASSLAAFGLSPFVAALVTADYQTTITCMLMAVLVWIRHKENIKRLANDTEGKINLGTKPA